MKTPQPPPRDSQTVILQAALSIFGRDGFALANVDEIARGANVAKPTIYNRFGDKRSLFVEAMQLGMARDARPKDLRSALEGLGLALAHCMTTAEGAAVVRLQIAERAHFPELDGMNQREQHMDMLAGKLAQLLALGYLRPLDPQIAARQFLALVTSEALAQGGYGLRTLPQAEGKRLVEAGVDTFLAAFGK
jgi:AcrR family transcriptional regulator